MNNEPTQEYKRGYNAGFEAGELNGKHLYSVKALTDEEIEQVMVEVGYGEVHKFVNPFNFARAILKKAQEK